MTEGKPSFFQGLREKIFRKPAGLRSRESYEDAVVQVVKPFEAGEIKHDQGETRRLQAERINTYYDDDKPVTLINNQEEVVEYSGDLDKLETTIRGLVDRSPHGTGKTEIEFLGEKVEVNNTGLHLLVKGETADHNEYDLIQPKGNQEEYYRLEEVVGVVRIEGEKGDSLQLITRRDQPQPLVFLNSAEYRQQHAEVFEDEKNKQRLADLDKLKAGGGIDAVDYLSRRPGVERTLDFPILDWALRNGDFVCHAFKQDQRYNIDKFRDMFILIGRRPFKKTGLRREQLGMRIVDQKNIENAELVFVAPEVMVKD